MEEFSKLIKESIDKVLIKSIIENMGMLEPDIRMDCIYKLREQFCLECGRNQPEDQMRSCQCWNDE